MPHSALLRGAAVVTHTARCHSGGALSTDLTPRNGARKRSRHWTVESQRELGVIAPKIATRIESADSRVPAQVSEPQMSESTNPTSLSPSRFQPALFAPSTLQATAAAEAPKSKSFERISGGWRRVLHFPLTTIELCYSCACGRHLLSGERKLSGCSGGSNRQIGDEC